MPANSAVILMGKQITALRAGAIGEAANSAASARCLLSNPRVSNSKATAQPVSIMAVKNSRILALVLTEHSAIFLSREPSANVSMEGLCFCVGLSDCFPDFR